MNASKQQESEQPPIEVYTIDAEGKMSVHSPPFDTPAAPSADAEIERIADLLHADVSKVFHRSLAADSRAVIRKRLEELATLLSASHASHANERQELIADYEDSSAERESCIKLQDAQIDGLKAELATAQRDIAGLKNQLRVDAEGYQEVTTALRSQLTEAQKLISDNHLVIEGLGDDLKEANAKLAEAFQRGYFCACAVYVKEEGQIDTMASSLINQGGDWTKADPEDVETFKSHGLSEVSP